MLNAVDPERLKVRCGWKSMRTSLAEGARIHYNFVRPHQGLEGQTPAQAAGVGVDGENRWFELLARAIRKRDGRAD
jgi:hypothetical protein